MKLMSSQIIGTSIWNHEQDSVIGRIHRVVVDPESGRVLAFAVAKSLGRLVNFVEAIWSKELRAFYVVDQDCICDLADMLRVEELVRQKRYFKRQRVITASGKNLGLLHDFEIDVGLGVLTQIESKRRVWIFNDFTLVPRSKIERVSARKIEVADDNAYVTVLKSWFSKKAAPVAGAAHSSRV